jgi:hypothetical protein
VLGVQRGYESAPLVDGTTVDRDCSRRCASPPQQLGRTGLVDEADELTSLIPMFAAPGTIGALAQVFMYGYPL